MKEVKSRKKFEEKLTEKLDREYSGVSSTIKDGQLICVVDEFKNEFFEELSTTYSIDELYEKYVADFQAGKKKPLSVIAGGILDKMDKLLYLSTFYENPYFTVCCYKSQAEYDAREEAEFVRRTPFFEDAMEMAVRFTGDYGLVDIVMKGNPAYRGLIGELLFTPEDKEKDFTDMALFPDPKWNVSNFHGNVGEYEEERQSMEEERE